MKVAIVDDSRLARVELKAQLAELPDIEVVGEGDSVATGLTLLAEHSIDLLLLDIDLPDGTGFDLLEQASQVPQVIFVTAFNEFAVKSFEFNALDYLLKPVRQERLLQALGKVQQQQKIQPLAPGRRIFIKDRDDCYFVDIDKVMGFEAMGNYTRVHLADAIPSVYRPISAIWERLDKDAFFKASRSWIINTRFVTAIESLPGGGLIATLQNQREVELSKRQAVEFKRIWSL